eukprot:15459064-Alexandrium_andersonii.AAC.1
MMRLGVVGSNFGGGSSVTFGFGLEAPIGSTFGGGSGSRAGRVALVGGGMYFGPDFGGGATNFGGGHVGGAAFA